MLTPEQLLPKFEWAAKQLCDGKTYDIDDENSYVIYILLLYFANNPEFEKLAPHACIGSKLSLDKGICLMGNSGSGKSLLLEIFSHMRMEGNKFFMYYADRLKLSYKEHGERAIAPLLKEYRDTQRNIPNNICSDELGYERQFKNYGELMPFMFDVIISRNRMWVSHRIKTHFTSNLDINAIGKVYDYRIQKRIEQMCNIIYLGGSETYVDRRK